MFELGQKVAIIKVENLESKCVYTGYYIAVMGGGVLQVSKLVGHSVKGVPVVFDLQGDANGKNEDNYHYIIAETA